MADSLEEIERRYHRVYDSMVAKNAWTDEAQRRYDSLRRSFQERRATAVPAEVTRRGMTDQARLRVVA